MLFDGAERPLEPGTVAYIPGGSEHQLRNCGNRNLTFICIVPEEGDKYTAAVAGRNL